MSRPHSYNTYSLPVSGILSPLSGPPLCNTRRYPSASSPALSLRNCEIRTLPRLWCISLYTYSRSRQSSTGIRLSSSSPLPSFLHHQDSTRCLLSEAIPSASALIHQNSTKFLLSSSSPSPSFLHHRNSIFDYLM